MGYYKNLQIRWHERGYNSIDTVVCSGCVGDYALKTFVKHNGQKQKCDYCGKVRICVGLEEMLELIVHSAQAEYEDANGCMGYNEREGGFQGADTYDNWQFVYDILNYEMEIEDDNLLQDIIKTLDDAVVWCEYDPYSLRMYEEDYRDWENFCKKVRVDKLSISEMASKYDVLDIIGQYIEKLNLVVLKNKSYGYYRSRPHKKIEKVNTAKDIGSAPTDFAQENRMSPQGVSMFYGAEDMETTLSEIDTRNSERVTTAKFFPTKQLRILNLTKLESIRFPSLFDENNRENRSPIIFLKRFSDDVSKSIDEKNKDEYRPTQVFTEYLRTKYQCNGKKVDGIIYKSSKNPGHKCCVLFFNNEECTDNKNEKNRELWMDKNSIFRKSLI